MTLEIDKDKTKEQMVIDAVMKAPEVIASTGMVASDGTVALVFWAKKNDEAQQDYVWFFSEPAKLKMYIDTLQKMHDVAASHTESKIITVLQ